MLTEELQKKAVPDFNNSIRAEAEGGQHATDSKVRQVPLAVR